MACTTICILYILYIFFFTVYYYYLTHLLQTYIILREKCSVYVESCPVNYNIYILYIYFSSLTQTKVTATHIFIYILLYYKRMTCTESPFELIYTYIFILDFLLYFSFSIYIPSFFLRLTYTRVLDIVKDLTIELTLHVACIYTI